MLPATGPGDRTVDPPAAVPTRIAVMVLVNVLSRILSIPTGDDDARDTPTWTSSAPGPVPIRGALEKSLPTTQSPTPGAAVPPPHRGWTPFSLLGR